MKNHWQVVAVSAIIGPAILSSLATEFYYLFNFHFQWLTWCVFVVTQFAAVTVLFKTLDWSLKVKVLLTVPTIFLSFVVTVILSLIVAGANGDGL